MEFTLDNFVNVLREKMYNLFPYEDDKINQSKHTGEFNRHPQPEHIRDVAFMNIPPIMANKNVIVFDIGSDYAEQNYSYYHILEDAPVIRKKHKGTKKTKGSQANVQPLYNRDYNKVKLSNGVFTREYQRNIRGARNSIVKNATYFTEENGRRIRHNAESPSYRNIHYQYIENILEKVAPQVADDFGLKFMKRVGQTDLRTDYILQELDIDDYEQGFLDQVFELGML